MLDLDALLYIDPKVLAQNYSMFSSDKTIKLLKLLGAKKEVIVTTYEDKTVFHELRKERLTRIFDGYKKTTSEVNDFPVFLPRKRKGKETISVFDLESHQSKLLADSKSDPLFKELKKLFDKNNPYILVKDKEPDENIKKLANIRCCLNYPPAQNGENPFIDSFTWEWIINCAKAADKHVVIVSGNKNYGYVLDNQSFFDEHLKKEFKKRVGENRNVFLTEKISEALEAISSKVDETLKEDESRLKQKNYFIKNPS